MMKKIALVTGASRGIGRAIAAKLAREGYAVCINYRVRKDLAEELSAKLTAEGREVMAVQADVSCREEVNAMVKSIEDTWGPVSLLVNNAGISQQGLFQDTTEEEWQRYLGVNLSGAIYAAQAVLPGMLHAHDGSIVNISSIWGLRGASCEVAYSCTKAALIGFTRSLALELAPSHIRVNCIAPGVIQTDMLAIVDDTIKESLREETPMGRLGTPEDIAGAVAFFASDSASFVTGQILTVDGGFIG